MEETLFNYTIENYFNLKMRNSFDCNVFHLKFELHSSLYICKHNKNYYFRNCVLCEHQDLLRSRQRNLISCDGKINHLPRFMIPKGIQWKYKVIIFTCIKIYVVHIR
jgi:hypothetical protein